MPKTLTIRYSTAGDECAVEGCKEPGGYHTCPAEGRRHSHGLIHYQDCHSNLTFRAGDWRKVCAAHYEALVTARAAWEARQAPRPAELVRCRACGTTTRASHPCQCADNGCQ